MNRVLLICFSVLLLASCQKEREKLQWDTDWTAPIAHGTLNLQNLIGDSLFTSNPDSSLLLKYEAELLKFDVSELIDLKDTTFTEVFALPFFNPVDFSPNQSFINQPENNQLLIEGAELTSVGLKNGTISYTLESTIQGNVIYTYQIPSATDANGNIFSKEVYVSAASANARSFKSGSFSLAGYTLDMTGPNGDETNRISTNINVKVNPNNSGPVSVSNQDTIFIKNTMGAISIQNAQGYFGMHSINSGVSSSALNLFDKLISGGFDIQNLSIDFKIENGIGVDAVVSIAQLFGKTTTSQINLNHSVIGVANSIDRALKIGGTISSSEFVVQMNQSNSNIIVLVEMMPDSLGYEIDVIVNPLANISGYGDFIDADFPLRVLLDATMPFGFIANELTLLDTINLNINDTLGLNSLALNLEINNGYPLAARIDISILDVNDMVVGHLVSPGEILAGEVDPTTQKVSHATLSYNTLTITSKDLITLKKNKKLLLKLVFDSPDSYSQLPIYDYYKIDYSIKGTANVGLEL